MSETVAEMVFPGTYIEVRSEGLIGVGGISTGNIGIVGSAARGPKDQVVPVGNYADAIDAFGPYDPYSDPTTTGHPLTLTRALELAFQGGARNVYAVRVANGDLVSARKDITATGGAVAFTLSATSGGSWGNKIAVSIVAEGTNAATIYKAAITYRQTKETFEGANAGALATAMKASKLVLVSGDETSTAGLTPIPSPENLAGGNDRADVTAVDVARGLAALEDETINIIVVAGEGSNRVRGVVAGHLDRMENEGKERIAVLGASESGLRSAASAVVSEADAVSDDRVVLVAPGVKTTDGASGKVVSLPPPYLAAVIAGQLSTLAPHVSLTNKAVPVDDLDVHYSTPLYKSLLEKRVLLVRKKFGLQVVKAITTDATAFKQISIRRTVDYAKAGVRRGADAYIGRLNNARVRAALKATLDGFLSQMVLDEMLVEYELDVSASRAQEIQGIASVVMTLKPTFSIDYIRVTIDLQ